MHVRHETLFRWLERTFPGGRLYGPYAHDGREYYQWMVRGAYLRDDVLPLLEATVVPELDAHAYDRLQQMKTRYATRLDRRATGASDLDRADTHPEIDYVTPDGTDVIDPRATI
jgi:hypothetical protein